MTTITSTPHHYEEFPILLDFLRREPLAFLSGGIGSQLALHDLPPHAPDGLPLIASLQVPDVLTSVHAAYAEAGASILTVDTFDLSPWRREKVDPDGARTAALGITAAYDAARRAQGRYQDRPLYLAGSLTSLEDCYTPSDTPSDAVLVREHFRQVALHARNNPDLLCLETIPTVREAAVMARAAQHFGVPYLVSFTADDDGKPLDGVSLEEAERATRSPLRVGIGVNCCTVPAAYEAVERLQGIFHAHAGEDVGIRHIAAYPNGYTHSRVQFFADTGLDAQKKHDACCEHKKDVFPTHEFAQIAKQLHRRGATLIGGCCGTSPAHTRSYTHALGGSLMRRPTAA